MRLWVDTFPWDTMVHAVEESFARRFPKKRPTGGCPPVSLRVSLALALLKHELGASDAEVCHRLRTDVAVMHVCGLREIHANHAQAHFVLPETLVHLACASGDSRPVVESHIATLMAHGAD
ncbi:MAG: transposase [Candidatus Tectomicrobia bacterium]|uniref:Transposase n=1 Tax=Tectimicrobiota bacterium TaxID=2528274 RepID=A0A938B225_UNCTE|nr:transposase [Candidatus Tectomicrobia bacterium]